MNYNKFTLITCLTLLVITIVSCFPKASQAIRELPVESKQDILATYSQNQLKEGENLFETSCARCHKLKPAANYTATEWNSIIKRMIPKAKLTDEQGKMVRAYVIANAKES